MSRAGRVKVKRIKLSSYNSTGPQRDCEPCGPSMRDLKARLKQNKIKMEDFITVTGHVDMDYNERNKCIGNLYMDRLYIKKDMMELRRKKQKAKDDRRKK